MNNKTKKRYEKMASRLEQAAYKTFAKLHPVECYDENPEKFCDLIRQNSKLTNEEIKKIIDSYR